jgi:hypothetical protein
MMNADGNGGMGWSAYSTTPEFPWSESAVLVSGPVFSHFEEARVLKV